MPEQWQSAGTIAELDGDELGQPVLDGGGHTSPPADGTSARQVVLGESGPSSTWLETEPPGELVVDAELAVEVGPDG